MFLSKLKGDDVVTTLRKLCLNSFVYHIWKERNRRDLSNQIMSADGVNHLIINDVRLKYVSSKISEMDSPQFRRMLDGWDIECIFKVPHVISCA